MASENPSGYFGLSVRVWTWGRLVTPSLRVLRERGWLGRKRKALRPRWTSARPWDQSGARPMARAHGWAGRLSG